MRLQEQGSLIHASLLVNEGEGKKQAGLEWKCFTKETCGKSWRRFPLRFDQFSE